MNYILDISNLKNMIKNIIINNQKINNYSSYFDNLPDKSGDSHIIDFDIHNLNKRDTSILTYTIQDENRALINYFINDKYYFRKLV